MVERYVATGSLKPRKQQQPEPRAKPRGSKQLVRVKYLSPEFFGTLIAEGPEQSEIKWPNGRTVCVPNEDIEKL